MEKITKEVYLKWYEDMLFWRKFEDKLAAVYIQQKVRGFLHLYNGQEAVLAGALHAMDLTKDRMITFWPVNAISTQLMSCHVNDLMTIVLPWNSITGETKCL